MSILSHFTKTKTKDYILYRLKQNEINELLVKIVKPARLCYIANNELASLCSKRGMTARDFIEKYILPDEPTIMSGDFGEIFSYLVVTENFSDKGFILFAPRKWRWKDNRNKPAPGSDAVMFHLADPKKPTPNDFVVSIESKMKAVKSTEHRLQTAIDHASKDKLTRLAKSIIWLEEKHAKHGSEEQRRKIERFKDPSTYGTFQKHHKAIAVIDSLFEVDETTPSLNNPHGVVAIVFCINDLKKVYEGLRSDVINSV